MQMSLKSFSSLRGDSRGLYIFKRAKKIERECESDYLHVYLYTVRLLRLRMKRQDWSLRWLSNKEHVTKRYGYRALVLWVFWKALATDTNLIVSLSSTSRDLNTDLRGGVTQEAELTLLRDAYEAIQAAMYVERQMAAEAWHKSFDIFNTIVLQRFIELWSISIQYNITWIDLMLQVCMK